MEWGIPHSSLATITKNKDKVMEQFENQAVSPARKRMRTAAYPDVEEALSMWFKAARTQNIPVSGPILQEKAWSLAKLLGHADFASSDGWLSCFKARHNIVFRAIAGEGAAGTSEMTKDWLETGLPQVLTVYDPHNIFNADETGPFYRLLPDRSLTFKGETYNGGKQSKERLTVMVCANMDDSEKMPLLVIGKSKKPRCFAKVKSVPAQRSQQDSLDDVRHLQGMGS
ncbi:tigger transposable element-derived protein 4-like [Acanthaster planci]|uniref:Tigger transposable element-derived protein 4-like n=1 Tax=Acanthaster planci TaxID=133434 RepID=A0A8B7Y328_ACAPL|nr:tigger transposable element-derived protein 4-like [Acanthaster planci]